MGRLVDGRWTDGDGEGGGARPDTRFDGEALADAAAAMGREPGRFHLVASLSCPWSHRVLIARRLRGLEDAVPAQVASGRRVEGYPVDGNRPWRLPGAGVDVTHVHEIYTASDPRHTGRASVPLLWDAAARRIVSNESMQLAKAFDRAAPGGAGDAAALRPEDLRPRIDALNREIHSRLATGVYRAGLARRQRDHDAAVRGVFGTLDRLEARLARGRLLFGRRLTLSDVVLFPVLARFDAVYNTHFRCTRRRLTDYPNLWAYARDLFGLEAFRADVDFGAIRSGYFLNDGDHNPHGIVPELPDADWRAPHRRAELGPLPAGLAGVGAPGPGKASPGKAPRGGGRRAP